MRRFYLWAIITADESSKTGCDMPQLQLIYFNLRALCEAPQMMMQTAGIDYSYEMCWNYFGKPWSNIKQDIPFGQLPILIVDGTKMNFSEQLNYTLSCAFYWLYARGSVAGLKS